MTENTATATELVETLKTATEEEATTILNGETQKPEADQRVTVIRAAQARLDALAAPGGPLEDDPEDAGAWAQLLDDDGKPVLEDGQPVRVDIVG